MHCISRYQALGKLRERSNKVARRSPISWNSTREPRKFAGFRASLWRWRWRSLFYNYYIWLFRWNLMDPALAFSYPYYGSYQYRWTLTPRSNALSSSRCPRTTLANVKFCCQPKDHLKHSKGPCNGYSNSIVVFMDLILIYSVRFWLSSEMAETGPCSQRSKTIVSTRHK